MLLFVIPIKSAKISRDWGLTSRLFERCVRAICNQTSPAFRVVVVCNERPDTEFSHPCLEYVEVDFPPPPMYDPSEEQTVGYELARSNDMARKNADKARKIHTGLDYAARFQPTHAMVVDADDCVSNRLAEFVAQHPDCPGWYLKRGYIYTEGGRFMHLNRYNFNVVCGTSAIFAYGRRDLVFQKADFYQHAFYDPPAGMVPLPFAGAVYSMANGDNIYMSAQTRNSIYKSLFKRVFSAQILGTLRKVVSYWPTLLTEGRRKEFGLYQLPGAARCAAPAVERALSAAS
jgi:hypothetical protein